MSVGQMLDAVSAKKKKKKDLQINVKSYSKYLTGKS